MSFEIRYWTTKEKTVTIFYRLIDQKILFDLEFYWQKVLIDIRVILVENQFQFKDFSKVAGYSFESLK
jgi:hypothetical protein